MKKILSLLSLAALTIGLLGSCSKINERLDNLEKDVNGLKNEKIASIESQIAGITSSIADLGTIRSDISSLKQSAENHSIDIFNLEEADRALKDRIDNLEDYLDVTLPKFAEKEWVEATFSTLEQYEETCDAIAEINVKIGELDARTARDIQACADSMKTWVNEQLDAYYTAAEMDASLAQMKADIDSSKASGKITDAKADSISAELTKTKTAVDSAKANIRKEYKAAIKSAIDSSEARLTKKIQNKIDKVNKNVEELAGRVSVLEAKVDELTGRVDKLEGMIQSVTIVPAYSDGSVEAINGLLELNLIVSPSSAAKGLTKEKVNILLNSVTTKAASVDTVDTDKIKSFIVDDTKGTVEIKADIKERLEVLLPTQILTVAVNVTDGGLSDVTTEFVSVDNTPGYTVKFNDGTTPATRDTTVLKGGKINKPANPTREDYFFNNNWFTKKSTGEKEVDWNFETMTVSQDTTLYAEWIKGAKVTFRKDTVNLTVCKDTIVRPSSTVKKPAVDPDSTGYAFKGWYTRKSDGSFDTEWNFSTNVTADTTLYAKWAEVMTVAELLANNKFPVSSSQDAIPDTAWVNGSNRCYYAQNSLVFKGDEISTSYTHDHKLTRQDDGSYQDEGATLTFVMAADRDSVVKITLNKTASYAVLNGTYAPKSSVPVNLYVEIEADYDDDSSTPNTSLKWYRQNLAISDSGKKAWKGDNTGDNPEVKVPGTNENVIVGDYFQWAAHAGYCGDASDADKGLLIYNSFINTKCVGNTGSNSFDFKLADESNKYRFNPSDNTGYKGISPYYSSGYQYYTDASHSTLSRETTYSGHNDDVANIILGDNWRMPTSAEFQAMRKVTYWAWDATDCGYYVFKPGEGTSGAANDKGNFNTSTDDKSKALLFFPAAGRGDGTAYIGAGTLGHYWSSSLNAGSTTNAYGLSFVTSNNVTPQDVNGRSYGISVRPVSD